LSLSSVPTLNDVCVFIEDCLHATAPIQEDGFPLIRTPNIGKGRLQLEGVHRVSEDTYQKWTRRAVPEPGDLILAREAPAGNVAVIKEGQTVCLGQRTVHLRPNAELVDSDYLCYFLLTPRLQGLLLAGETGATAKHVNMKDIRRLPLGGLHRRETQTEIGRAIAVYDDLIENNRRRIKLLEKAARLIYREWFVRLRFPGHEHTKIENGVPEGWTVQPLRDLADVVRGRSYKGSELSDADGLAFVNLKCFERFGGFRDSGLKRYTGPFKPEQTVSPGDVVMAVTDMTQDRMIVAQAGRIPRTVPSGSVFSMDVVKIAPKQLVASDWLYSYLRFSGFSASVSLFGSGATVVHLSPRLIEQHLTLTPPRDIRDDFAEQVGKLYACADVLGLQTAKLRNARDLLLPRLMSGEIEV